MAISTKLKSGLKVGEEKAVLDFCMLRANFMNGLPVNVTQTVKRARFFKFISTERLPLVRRGLITSPEIL